ncbi:hypothetical protein CEUSTIGMA_g7384.t1, partial [Chlamydomonas eustigma]
MKLSINVFCAGLAMLYMLQHNVVRGQGIPGFPPNCTCDRTPSHSPFRMAYSSYEIVPTTGYAKMCFVVNVVPCDKTATCCLANQTLYKLDMAVVPTCKPSLKEITIDGVRDTVYTWSTTVGVLTIREIGKTAANAQGTQICLFLESPCNTAQTLCSTPGFCEFALFNNVPARCCPISFAYPFNPPFTPESLSPPPP